MDHDKIELAMKVAVNLEKDLSRFVDNLSNGEGIPVHPKSLQSSALTTVKLPDPVSSLGQKLMKELLSPTIADIHLRVGDEVFLCHREVISTRCDYFAAMLRHDWAETTLKEVILENITPEGVACLLCFLYGGSVEIPKFCPLSVVAQVADMYCMSELADAVKLHIATEVCHSFHKPCKVCRNNFAEALQICSTFGKCETLSAVLRWNSIYFSTFWRNDGYYTLLPSLRKKCLAAVKRSVNVCNVIDKVIKVDQLLSSMTRVKWTMPVIANASELMSYCCSFITSNMWSLVENKTIIKLFEGFGFKSDIVDRILMEIMNGISTRNACDIYLSAAHLHDLSSTHSWNERSVELLSDLKKKVYSYLVSNHFAVIHTHSWANLTASDREAIAAQSLCGGDAKRKLSKKPVLSSSQNIKPPKPAVLSRAPMKIKPRKENHRVTSFVRQRTHTYVTHRFRNNQAVGESFLGCHPEHGPRSEAISQPSETQSFIMERQPIIAVEEFLPGVIEVSHICYYKLAE